MTELKGEVEAQLSQLATNNLEVKLPPAIRPENKLNVIMVGPSGCGKTVAANYMAQEHQRCVVRMNQLIEFWQNRNHPLADEAAKYLEDKEEELKNALAE